MSLTNEQIPYAVGAIALVCLATVLIVIASLIYRWNLAETREPNLTRRAEAEERAKTEIARAELASEKERTAQAKIWADKARAGEVFCPQCGSVATTKRPRAGKVNQP